MTRSLCSVALALVLLGTLPPPPSSAQTQGLGVGATLGVTNGISVQARHPVGLSGKVWLSDHQALAGMTSFSLAGDDQSYWTMQGDLLFHNFTLLSVEGGLLPMYIGGGAQYTVLEGTDNQFALRSPVGVSYLFDTAPLDLFVEVAPTLKLTEPESLRFDGALGFRYYFSSGKSNAAE